MSSLRLSPALLGALAAAVVGVWVGYALVAGVTPGSSQGASRVEPEPDAAPAALELTPAPALRVRPLLLKHAQEAIAQPAAPIAQPTPTSAPDPNPTPSATPPAASAPAAPAAAPEPAAPAPSAPPAAAPAPRPAPKPQPTLTAKPKRASPPDFDESAPSGFDTAG